MNREHFVIAPEAISRWANKIPALCGEEVEHAEPGPTIAVLNTDHGTMPELNSLTQCVKCYRAVQARAAVDTGRLYLYGIIRGEALEESDYA